MTAAVIVALLWLLFGGTHIGLAALRPRLIARLGAIGFGVVFYAVAAVTFTALVTYYAAHRFDGAAGLALGTVPGLRWLLVGIAAAGIVLATPALTAYPRLPTALFDQPIRAPRGIERISRHPFFVGLALLAAAHLGLATHAVGAVFFIGLLLLCIVGAWHQDRKLRARRGAAYADYCAATSVMPFAAIVAGRQRFAWRELPAASLALGLGLALAARQGHDQLFAAGGLWLAGIVVAGGSLAGLNAWRRSRRLGAQRTASAVLARERAGRMIRLAPRLLIVTGLGHTLVGLVLFRAPLVEILTDGVVHTIRYGQFERAAAFWFLLFGPACVLFGQLVGQATRGGDRRSLTLIGSNLLAMGVAGAVLMPISGFWILLVLAPMILRGARAVGAPPPAPAGPPT